MLSLNNNKKMNYKKYKIIRNIKMEEEIIRIGKSQLTEFQIDILYECLKKKSGGLSLTMGSGKTFVSLVLALEQTKESKKPILVVASKTLIESWIFEIKKFFGDKLNYIVLHSSYIKKLNEFVLGDEQAPLEPPTLQHVPPLVPEEDRASFLRDARRGSAAEYAQHKPLVPRGSTLRSRPSHGAPQREPRSPRRG